jgi:cytochrome c oxidase assembly protein subunit 15
VTILVMAAQGVLGYVQYFNRIPPVLVGFHVFGAVCVFICVQQLLLELRVADEPISITTPGAPAGTTTKVASVP